VIIIFSLYINSIKNDLSTWKIIIILIPIVWMGFFMGLMIKSIFRDPAMNLVHKILKMKYVKLYGYMERMEGYMYFQEMKKHEFWLSLDGLRFERELANVFELAGYYVKLTKGSGDKGVDIFLKNEGKHTIVQCKAHKKAVGPATVRDLYGTMLDCGADEAILASTNGFTIGVYEFVKDKNIQLWDIDTIIEFKEKHSGKRE